MTDNLPPTLASSAARPPGVRPERQRRARYNIPGKRANTLPDIIPGMKIFRIVPDSKVGRATLREWGRKHGYEVKDHGKIPAVVRDAFMKVNGNGSWTVRIVSVRVPGDTEFRQYYSVKQGPYERKQTRHWWDVQNVLGDELFALLQEVK